MTGSIALLLWGSITVRDAVEGAFAASLNAMISRAGGIRGVLGGLFAALCMQSATATILLATSLVASGVLGLGAATGVILGADLGSALAARILFLDLSLLPPIVLSLGVVLHLLANTWRMRSAGRILVGLGLMLLAIQWMKALIAPVAGQPLPGDWMSVLGSVPWFAMVVAALATWFAHSSVAAVLLIATLAHSGVLPPALYLPMLLGANIGAGLIVLPMVGGRSPASRSAALCNLGFRVTLALAALVAADWYAPYLDRLSPDPGEQVVIGHVVFNALLVCLFLPFAGRVAERVRQWLERRYESHGAARMIAAGSGLDPELLRSPLQALACARREAGRMGDLAEDLLTRALEMFSANDRSEIERLVQADREINSRNRAIHQYLSEARRHLRDEAVEIELDRVLHFASTMENIGDIVSHDLSRLAVKRLNRGVSFSPEGLAEIRKIHGEVMALLRTEINGFVGGLPVSAKTIHRMVGEIRALCEHSIDSHRRRLSEHRLRSQGTSSIHQDTVRDLMQIAGLLEHRPVCSVNV